MSRETAAADRVESLRTFDTEKDEADSELEQEVALIDENAPFYEKNWHYWYTRQAS